MDRRLVERLRAGSDRDPGILLYQTSEEIFGNKEFRAYEITELHLNNVIWEEVNGSERFTNNTSLNATRDYGPVDTSRPTFQIPEPLQFQVNGESVTLSNRKDTRGRVEKTSVTIQPGQTLYRYQRVFNFFVRTWWVLECKGQKFTVTWSDSESETYCRLLPYSVVNGMMPSTTEITGKGILDTQDISAGWKYNDPEWPTIPESRLPEYIQELVPAPCEDGLGEWDIAIPGDKGLSPSNRVPMLETKRSKLTNNPSNKHMGRNEVNQNRPDATSPLVVLEPDSQPEPQADPLDDPQVNPQVNPKVNSKVNSKAKPRKPSRFNPGRPRWQFDPSLLLRDPHFRKMAPKDRDAYVLKMYGPPPE